MFLFYSMIEEGGLLKKKKIELIIHEFLGLFKNLEGKNHGNLPVKVN